ncbi:MAG: ATP-binding protein, partial [Syntrophobacteraceae bacterium]
MKHAISLANKLTLWYAAIFILCFGGVFGLFYLIMYNNFYAWTDAELKEEVLEVHMAYKKAGLQEVIQQMKHEEATEPGQFFGRLIDVEKNVVFETAPLYGGQIQVNETSLERIVQGETDVETLVLDDGHRARVTYSGLPDGSIAQVGLALRDHEIWMRKFSRSMLTVALFVFALAVIASALIARKSLAPIEVMATLASEITGHSMGRRMPVFGHGNEVDSLSRSFNAMLDRIDALVHGLREVTDSLAHDLRTPITSMRGMAELSLRAHRSQDDYREALCEIMEQLDGLLNLFNSILDVAEAENGALALRKENVRMDLLAEQVLQTFEPVARDKGISLEARISPNLLVKGDQSRLIQVLVNLVDNALKYTPSGGNIRLVMEPDAAGQEVIITVADSGIGVSDKDLPHIFERYYRSDKSRSGTGFGLGLPLVRGIVLSHGGSVTVASKPAQGSSFKVFLPVNHN